MVEDRSAPDSGRMPMQGLALRGTEVCLGKDGQQAGRQLGSREHDPRRCRSYEFVKAGEDVTLLDAREGSGRDECPDGASLSLGRHDRDRYRVLLQRPNRGHVRRAVCSMCVQECEGRTTARGGGDALLDEGTDVRQPDRVPPGSQRPDQASTPWHVVVDDHERHELLLHGRSVCGMARPCAAKGACE